MWNLSRTAVPPDVNSRSSVALFMFVLSVSQWPTSAFSFSNASLPFPAAEFGEGMIPTQNSSMARTFPVFLIDHYSFQVFLLTSGNRTTRNSGFTLLTLRIAPNDQTAVSRIQLWRRATSLAARCPKTGPFPREERREDSRRQRWRFPTESQGASNGLAAKHIRSRCRRPILSGAKT